MINMDVVMAR